MKKLLITAFEPFGGEDKNSSLMTLMALPDAIGDFELIKLEVPCVFGLAAETVIAKAEEIKPDAILSLGQAATRSQVTPELVAINLRNARIPDNRGNSPQREAIDDQGPAAYFSTLPVFEMSEAIKDQGIPSAVSYSAGTFVCNDLFFSLRHHFRDEDMPIAFIHLPLTREQATADSPGMDLSDMILAIIKTIETITIS